MVTPLMRRILTLACGPCLLLYAQKEPRITAPANGAVVHSGESMKVRVEAPGFTRVVLSGWTIGVIGTSTQAPHEFSVKLEPGMAADSYTLTAFGVTANGVTAQSEPVLVRVERPDVPVRLKVNLPTLTFGLGEVRGPGVPLVVSGVFADGLEVDLRHSLRTTYTTDQPGVVKVDLDGRVTPVGPGSAKITIRHAGLSLVVPVRVMASGAAGRRRPAGDSPGLVVEIQAP